ncbi:pyridoxamine 5'-phosphate oxidase family protein [Danxiaibacter flavus]|uniref:Pyridoxamine 5'-phosphate oxidase family protein n=1 Tax=Danxiaibacter flavus TaxID=3049108 RepID=A0ABV3ZHV0_9BACT|nr:pyridoxamine 5'-phosphate oxidase family protein [Chitinophagaceae bacterium DXS]
MVGKLTDPQIEEVLKKQIFGRIGCHADDTTYIVPISFAYDGKNIYCHSLEGKKIEMMRKNPRVCFEVDLMENMGNWESVICWGRFEELTDPEPRKKAVDLLLHRKLPVISSETVKLTPSWPFFGNEEGSVDGIIFRIAVEEKTGRYESQDIKLSYTN